MMIRALRSSGLYVTLLVCVGALVTGCPAAPTAGFSGTPREGNAPLAVQFSDTSDAGSSPIDTWEWSFGDGGSSGASSPSHVYEEAGVYSVSLTVSTSDGADTQIEEDYIVVNELPEAGFFTAVDVDNPFIILFLNTSTPGNSTITSWNWDFGDGTTSTAREPEHEYQGAGEYEVTLTVTTVHGSDTFTATVEVEDPAVPPTAAFTYEISQSNGLEVMFTDTSTPGSASITAWAWDFGDSSTSSDASPTHEFPGGGTYEVVLTVTTADGSDSVTQTIMMDGPGDDEEEASTATLSLRGFVEGLFLAGGGDVIVDVTGGTFDTREAYTTVLVNGELLLDDSVEVTSTSVRIIPPLEEGRNDLSVYGQDASGGLLAGDWTVWVGSWTLAVTVLDSQGSPVAGATVKAALSDDVSISLTATTDGNGIATLLNVPDRTLLLEAQSSTNEVGAVATTGDAGSVTVTLKAFNDASPIDNNDLGQGTDGWDTNGAPVTVVPSDETKATNNKQGNQNLLLTTAGEGPVTISRTFVAKPGTKRVGIRYAFITTEVPGGYHGSQYNDGYSVSIRTKSGGQVVADSRSMNSFPVSEFDANGRTAFRELSTPLNVAGDTVQVDLTVTNVGDGLYDSSILVDLVFERSFDVVALNLFDIDNAALQFLSASSHTYFMGNTRIHGTIQISGSEGDGVASLKLNVLHGGSAVAVANLSADLQPSLIRAFDAGGILEVTTPRLMFLLPAAQAALVEATGAESVTLQVEAVSTGGETARKNYAVSSRVLLRYTNTNRYPADNRDGGVGGDDWVRKSVRSFLDTYADAITIGDISNMNGGQFPPHATHRQGVDIDGWFSGYNARDAAAAATMLELLYRPNANRITTVFVSYQRIDSDEFWTMIKDVKLGDDRAAKDVIRPLGNHTTHFHWIISE